MTQQNRAYKYDHVLLLVTVLLLAIGLVMVFSASFVTAQESSGDPYQVLKRQALWVAIGLAALFFFSHFHYKNLKRYSLIILVLNFVFLALIFSNYGTDLGTEARRWLNLGPVVIQPSEFSKFAIIIFTAAYMSSRRLNLHNFWTGALVPIVMSAITFLMILYQPDMGTALVVIVGCGLVIVFAGMPLSQLVGLFLLVLPPVAYFTIKEDYRMQRLFTLFDPWAEPTEAGYQIIQSLYALGPGHIFGMGLGRSKQKLFYLPESQNDFIFAVIGEELGFIGAVTVLMLYMVLVWRGLQVALRAPDLFSSLLAAGITFMIAAQVIINVAVVTGSIPVTGINLPLISAGGSSIVFTLLGIGVLLNISKHGQDAKSLKGAA